MTYFVVFPNCHSLYLNVRIRFKILFYQRITAKNKAQLSDCFVRYIFMSCLQFLLKLVLELHPEVLFLGFYDEL